MGLSGGILKRVFSKSRSREFNERSSSENSTQKSRWVNSVRIYLCGDEVNSHPIEQEEEEQDLQEETHINAISKQNSNRETSNNEVISEMHEEINTEEVKIQEITLQEEKAAIIIQSAFKGLMVRRILKEMKKIEETENKDEFYENTENKDEFYENTDCATVATSTEVQIGESFNTLRLSEDTVSFQHREFSKGRPPIFRVKEEWDDSTLSSNAAKIRMQNRLEATTRRERALAYAFSQQLRTCNTKKRSSQCDSTEQNVSWSWLERWMATRNPEPDNPLPDDCMSKNLQEFFIPTNRKTILIKNKRLDVSFEGKESCGSNDVSVNFEGFNANSISGTTTTNGGNKIGKNRSKNASKNMQRKKGEMENHHGSNSRLKKVSKKEHGKQEELAKECDNSQSSNKSSVKS
ncbi:hypothetical protein LUZ60_017057 [Juncus effusus]|nr:hypothetical protein LUZ60_017057 [Juncus effusus]